MEHSLKNYLEEKVHEHWNLSRDPFLLSFIGKDYKKDAIKEQTEGLSIISWINKNSELLSVKIVSHPSQKAKIGLIPKNENFSYQGEEFEIDTLSINNNKEIMSDRDLTLSFIALLQRKCTSKELEQIHIPINILLKLL